MVDSIEGGNRSNPCCCAQGLALPISLPLSCGCRPICGTAENPRPKSLVIATAGFCCGCILPNNLGNDRTHAALGDGVGGNGVNGGCPGVALHADARKEADEEETGGAKDGTPDFGDDGGEWITSIDNGWMDPPRLPSKLLWCASPGSSSAAGTSCSMQRLSAKLIRLRCTGFLAGTMV